MGGGQDVDLNEPLPAWASRRAHGDYRIIGAVLPTRDGRNCGNATLILWSGHEAIVRTDAGNDMRLTENEIRDWFWPPEWVRREFAADTRGGLVKSLRELAIVHTMKPGIQAVVHDGHRCRVCATRWALKEKEQHQSWCALKGTEA